MSDLGGAGEFKAIGPCDGWACDDGCSLEHTMACMRRRKQQRDWLAAQEQAIRADERKRWAALVPTITVPYEPLQEAARSLVLDMLALADPDR